MSHAQGAEKCNVLWFIPTFGDTRYLGTTRGARPADIDYLKQIAMAVDTLGYYGVLIPTGRACEDSYVVAAALSQCTQQLRFLVAARPGIQSPTFAARLLATLDRVSRGRTLINVVTGGDPVENRGEGLNIEPSQRYELTREFMKVYCDLLRGETINHKGRFIEIEDGRLTHLPVQEPYPPMYFGGSSDAGIDVAAETIDKFLTWGEPPAAVAEKIAKVRKVADAKGRKVSFGIRLHVIVRETAEEAWAVANKTIEHVTDDAIAAAQKVLNRFDSVGQKRMSELHGGRRDKLEVSPNLWAGIGLVRGGAGTALVGDPQTVADRMKEYMALGIDTFVMSGYPHLEEAYQFAEQVFPLLPMAHGPLYASEKTFNTGPFGEVIGREPRKAANQVVTAP